MGGAICLTSGYLIVKNSTFTNNRAIGGTGGVGGNQGINGNGGAASPVYTGNVDNSYRYEPFTAM